MEKDKTSSSVSSQSTLCSTLYVPVAQRQRPQLSLDQRFPHNPSFVNLTADILKIISDHFHQHPSYTNPQGHSLAREYLATFFGVRKADVFLAPTNAQAYWYLLNLFLDNGEAVACNYGFKADLLKVKTDTDYQVLDLNEMDNAKLIMARYPDIDSEATLETITNFATKLPQLELAFKSPKVLAVEEPFALLNSDKFGFSVRNVKLPERTPTYLITSLGELLLSEASDFSIIVLLNNHDGRFDRLNSALTSLAEFYNPPNTALHPLISKILPAIDRQVVSANFEALEERKLALARWFFEKKIETIVPPANVFAIGVKKSQRLADLVLRGEVRLPAVEKFRPEHPFAYLSVLYPDALFDALAERL